MPVAQLGSGQVALAVSHFPSGLKAALLSAVSELLPFVQFSIATLLSASAAFNTRREEQFECGGVTVRVLLAFGRILFQVQSSVYLLSFHPFSQKFFFP